MKAQDILDRFDALPDYPNDGRAFCGAHEVDGEGHNPSLIIDFNRDTRKVLLHCESKGCDAKDMANAVGLDLRDLRNVTDIPVHMGHKGLTSSDPASPEARQQEQPLFLNSTYALANHTFRHLDDAADPVVRTLEDKFGIPASALTEDGTRKLKVTQTYNEEMGIGLDMADKRLWVTARTADGEVAYAQSRSTDGSEPRWSGLKNPKDSRWDAVGFIGRRHPGAPVIITEGPSDALTVAALDKYDVVAIRGATNGDRIIEVLDALRGREVYLAIDNDEAGLKCRATVTRVLTNDVEHLRVVKLPAGSDVGDLRANNPANFGIIFETMLATADDVLLVDAPIDWGPDNLRWHDRIAARFVRYSRGKAMFVPGKGWHVWNGQYWSPDRTESGVWRILDEVIQKSWTDANENLRKDLMDVMKAFGKKSVLEIASKQMERIEVDVDPYLLNCENGTIELHDGNVHLREHRPEDFITKTTGVRYDPAAKGTSWNAFLESSLPDENEGSCGFLQRYCGVSLVGRVREHMIAVMTGSGRNGKGVFVRALEGALGDYIGPNVKDILLKSKYNDTEKRSAQDNDALMGLKGCRVSCISELPKGASLDEATVKFLTGGDDIMAKYSHGSYQSFAPSHSFILQTNELPEVDADSPAIWARLRVIPWTVSFIGREDTSLDERLESAAEKEAILAWCVEGLRLYWAEGGKLHAPKTVTDQTDHYREANDTLAQFMKESVDLDGNKFVAKTVFKEAYKAWLRENDAGDELKARPLKEKLRAEYGVHDDGPKKRYLGSRSPVSVWTGMDIKSATDDA